MAWRIREEQVKGVVETDSSISLEPFINAAEVLTDDIETNDTAGLLSAARLVQIEIFLAAHFYSMRDQLYKSKSTAEASASFRGSEEPYLDAAKAFDATGYLENMFDKQPLVTLTGAWLGKAPSDQTDYEDRD